MKKALALTLAAAMSAGLLAGCSGGETSGTTSSGSGETGEAGGIPAYNELTVGEDYTDLTAELRVISHRTDLIQDGTFDKYIAAFNEMYPNITISYEGITDYASDMTTRLTSNDWGDICMIPTTIPLPELGDYFYAMCDLSAIQEERPGHRLQQGRVRGRRHHRAAQDAHRVPGRPAGHCGQHRRHPPVHQLRGRLDHERLGCLHWRRCDGRS